MIHQVHCPLPFTFMFTATKRGKTGLTVLVTVYDADGDQVVTNAAATEVGHGLYAYSLSGSLAATAGWYRAVGKTTDATVDQKHIPCVPQVADWAGEIAEWVALLETPTPAGSVPTRASLLASLRNRLDDRDHGNYTSQELYDWIELAYRETVVVTRSRRMTTGSASAGVMRRVRPEPEYRGGGYVTGDLLDVIGGASDGKVQVTAVVNGAVIGLEVDPDNAGTGYAAGTTYPTSGGSGTFCIVRVESVEPCVPSSDGLYDVGPIFELIEVSLAGEVLPRTDLGALGITVEQWNDTPAAMPERWMPAGGRYIRLYPNASAESGTRIGTVSSTPTAGGAGYQVADVLSITSPADEEATVRVEAVSGGAVTTVKLLTRGYGYTTTGAGKPTTGGHGTGCTVNITSVAAITIHGYAEPEPMTADWETPDALPQPYAASAILDRAEAEARMARSRVPGNVEAAAKRMAMWAMWCEEIERRLGGKQ